MKVCQINCVYGVGSTGKITRDIHHSLLSNGFESIVIAPVKSEFSSEPGVYYTTNKFLSYTSAILRRCLGMQYDWAHIQTRRLIRILRHEQPDIVHLQCINGNDINIYALENYLSKNKIKTVYTLHAEFPYTGGCGYAYECNKWLDGCGRCPNLKESTQSVLFDRTHRTWKKLYQSYLNFDPSKLLFTTVSPWLHDRAQKSPMLSSFKKTIVLNGVDTNVFFFHEGHSWKEKLGIAKDEKMIIHVTARFFMDENNIKGGRYIVSLAKKLQKNKIKIVVVAGLGKPINLPDNIIYLGRAKSQMELSELYSESDLSVITSKRETFCMPVAESLCCGTPVVGFKAGGPESIALSKYSRFVDFEDVDSLAQACIEMINMNINKETISREAISSYNKLRMTNEFIDCYKIVGKC